MENTKHDNEPVVKPQAIELDSDIEQLERREAPKLAANHNETMLRSDM